MKTKSDDNKYRKVLLAAQRTRQLQKGAIPRVKATGARASRIALTEINEGLIQAQGEDHSQEETLCSVPPAPTKSLTQAKPTKKGAGSK
jgi:DNA-directed RNA polymerase omega subunit